MGIKQRAEILKGGPGVDKDLIDSQVKRLTDPDWMGENFKFMYAGLKKNGEVFPFIDNTDRVYK